MKCYQLATEEPVYQATTTETRSDRHWTQMQERVNQTAAAREQLLGPTAVAGMSLPHVNSFDEAGNYMLIIY